MSIDWDIEELAGYAMGEPEDVVESLMNDNTMDELLHEKYGVDLETYCKIVKDLLPFTPKVQAGISKEFYHAFLDEKNQRMIVKLKSIK